MPRKTLSFIEAAIVVLRQHGQPLTAQQIMHLAIEWRLLETRGRTPHTAMRARLYTNIRKNKRRSPFRLARPGLFGLAEWRKNVLPTTQESTYLRAAAAVLGRSQLPMSAREIVRRAIELGLLDKTASHNTMRARLSMNIARNRGTSTFARTAANRFALREWINIGRLQEFQSRPFRKALQRGQQVLVVPQATLDQAGRFQGIRPMSARYLNMLKGSEEPFYAERIIAEETDEWKQILAYILVTIPDGRYVAFRRGSYSNIASFLAGQRCLGFGGHLDPLDRTLFTAEDWGLAAGAERELREELFLGATTIDRVVPIGVLNDDTSPVGLKHFAFLFRAELSQAPRRPRDLKGEWDVGELTYLSKGEIEAELHEFEYWSQLCALKFVGVETTGARTKRRSIEPLHRESRFYAVAGEIGSGKTEVSAAISAELRIPVISTRVVVENLLGTRLSERNRLRFSDRASELVATEEGLTEYTQQLVAELRPRRGSGAVLDGVRHPGVVERLRKAKFDVVVVYVSTLPDRAYQFYKLRIGRDISVTEFRARRQHIVERQIPLMAPDADVTVYNYGSLPSLRQAVGDVLR